MMRSSDGLAEGLKPSVRATTEFGGEDGRCTGDELIDGCLDANVGKELVENSEGEKVRN